MRTLPLLVVQHEDDCPPGWFGEWLLDAGADLDVRRPYAGDTLPEDLSAHAGLLVLGGDMGAHDDAAYPWLSEVKALVRAAASDGTPTLGVCLGHQLAAVALGGDVVVNPRGQQVGVLDVGWTDAARTDPLMRATAELPAGAPAAQWNNDVVTLLPEGATVLARAATGELQAARHAHAVWGVQWHPEAGAEIIGGWIDADRDAAAERGVDLDGYLADIAAAGQQLRATWRVLAASFAAVCGVAEDQPDENPSARPGPAQPASVA